ncbi:alpha/beta hydrolase [Echinicola salinicaeni]|uniref:alpha/beta hydrolase n=1 Tax=Echinicola salinicaeni TaxID=2762757 RepID=UPI001C93CB26|nr:alpha/beta hydrolase fold domain-containing protein [Echinicola salinicaeni]
MKIKFISTYILLLLFTQTFAQETLLYKTADTTNLYMEVYYPPMTEIANNKPAMVFFFGGGWVGGSKSQFQHHAQYFSKRGLVCFLVDYRIRNVHGTSPFESLMDAKSAIRYIRKNADDFNIDPDKIIGAGGSAGGHLAAATAVIPDFNDPNDNHKISCIPNALVLFNPVIDNGPGGYGYERIGEQYKDYSPLHNLKAGLPPTIFFLGTDDKLIPVETAEYYQTVSERIGSQCDLYLYQDEGHGFFNYGQFDNYKDTILKTDKFLQSLGYLNQEPVIEIK